MARPGQTIKPMYLTYAKVHVAGRLAPNAAAYTHTTGELSSNTDNIGE